MNRLNFNQPGGFPLETEVLDQMQKGWAIFKSLGAIVGDLAIVSGCQVAGSTVGDGLVNINGELLEFRGGLAQTKVIIVESVTGLEFEDTNTRDVVYTRYATFGTATTYYLWADFKRGLQTSLIPEALDFKEDKTTVQALITRIEDLEARPVSNVPNGLIAIWGRPFNQIPADWQEYVPLRNRIPIGLGLTGTDFDVLGDFGGSKEQTLTVANLAPHDHLVKFYAGVAGVNINNNIDSQVNGPSGNKTSETGEGEPFSIMNPYRVVLFIEYIG